ncbi:MAG: A24 family peptidase [Gemmatimonadota bacterium]
MGALDLLLGVGLVGTSLVAALSDLRHRRIPNWLTVSSLVGALAIRLALGGAPGLGSGALAAAIAFGIGFPLFVVRAMGGGDVKLLAAVGAFLGKEHLWAGLAATALVGGVLASVVAIRRGAVQRTLRLAWRVVRSLAVGAASRRYVAPPQTLTTPGALTVPYGVAIAVGAVVGFYW